MRSTTLALPLALLACRSAPRAAPVTTAVAATPPAATRAAAELALARAREFAEMPRCEASDAVTLARTAPGVPATPTIARNASGALVAFVAVPEGERAPKVMVIALDAQGNRAGEQAVALLDGGESPALPALAAEGDGFVLAWRSGAPGRQQVRTRRLDARGVPAGETRTLASPGWVGGITLHAADGRTAVAFPYRIDRAPGAGSPDATPWATRIHIHDGRRDADIDAPPGGAFTGEAPRLTGVGDGLRVWALTARANGRGDDEHALVTRRVADGDTLHLVARDLDHIDAHALSEGTLVTWRARVARRDVALRAAVIRDDGTSETPPLTLATFGGAADLRGALVPLGPDHVAALTLATLADDANGSVNLSVMDRAGAPLGRAPALTSVLARDTALGVAPPPPGTSDGLAWAVIDGRDSHDGRPTLLLTRLGCDPQRTVPRLDLHPATWVQQLAPPDAAPIALARLGASPAAMSCETRATRPWAPHASGQENALVGSSAAVVITPAGAQLYAVTRTAEGRTRLVTSTLNAQGVATPLRTVREGDVTLPPAARPFDAMVPASALREGDTVSDALRDGAATLALVARPDDLGAEVASTLGLYRGAAADLFADPLGHPRGRVVFTPSRRDEPGARAVLFNDRGTLRRSEIVDGVLRAPQSLMETFPGGGEILAASGSGATRWVALVSGDPGEGHNVGALTLAAMDASGVRGASLLFPEDGSVIPQGVAMAAQGDRVVLLFPRAEQGGTVTWTWADLRCTVPGGAR